jgi:hypothetical protein
LPPLPLSPAEAAAVGAAALAAAAAAPPPRDAIPVATGDVVAGLEALFRRLLVPSDAVLRAGARLIAPERLARMARFASARLVAALEEWEAAAAAPAGRARAEATLDAIAAVRRRFLTAVLSVGGAQAMAALLAADAARGDGAAAAAAAAARVAPKLSPPQRAALADACDAYRAAVKEARQALRAALARAADAAAPPPGADAAHLVAHIAPAAAAAAAALDAAAAGAAAAAHAESEAEALVVLAAALTAALSPVEQARVQRAFAPWAVDLPALVEAFANFCEAA